VRSGADEAREESDAADAEDDNVRSFSRRPGTRRTAIRDSLTSSSDDSKTLNSHARILEVEGASDRLGIAALRETLDLSEEARRRLTQDSIEARTRQEVEIDRIRDEYEKAADASESRHAAESRRWREEIARLNAEIRRLEEELDDAKKAKKKHKKAARSFELQIEELREKGAKNRAILGLLAPGVPPIAEQVAKHVPDLFIFLRSVVSSAGVRMPAEQGSDEEAVRDRAAAIRFAGRLFDQTNEDVLGDLQKLAFDVIEDRGEVVIVQEWDRVQRYIMAALRHEAEAGSEHDADVGRDGERAEQEVE